MSNADDLHKLALRLAEEHFEEAVQRLVDAAAGDRGAVTEACERTASANTTADSAEHIAFTYLSAAFGRLADELRS